MAFSQSCRRGIKLIRNNVNKILIGNTALILGHDSYIFRKETTAEKISGTIKYNNCSLYSQIMKPIRKIKDYYWINKIHQHLMEDEEYIVNGKMYTHFLSDFPHQIKIYNETYCHYDPNFTRYILQNELKKNKEKKNNKIIMWCFQEGIKSNLDILSINSKYLDECDDLFFIPENIIECKDPHNNNYMDSVVDLLSNEYYMSRLNKINPKYITSFLNYYSYVFNVKKFDDFFDDQYTCENYKNWPKYMTLMHFIESINKNNTLKNYILNNFNCLNSIIKEEIKRELDKNV